MNRRRFIHTALVGTTVLTGLAPLDAAAARKPLPEPSVPGSLQHALENRRSLRSYAGQALDEATLAGLLWAGFGVNRADSGKRTAPSAYDNRETDIYVATAAGLFLYDATAHALETIHTRDIRSLTGAQPFVDDAAANLVYVADFERMARIEESRKPVIAAYSVGSISQNVALYCAANGLGNVVRDWIDRETLRKEMGLTATQHIMLAQTVGVPE
jgi:nitroreductase